MDRVNQYDLGRILVDLGQVLRRTAPRQPGTQENEQEIIDKLFFGTLSGFYVDVGVYDPIEGNNTYSLYRRGWRGVLVEPLKTQWQSIMGHRMGDWLVGKAASNKDGYGVLRVDGPCSSLEADWQINPSRTEVVELQRLSEILKKFPEVERNCHFCSIDAEGHERAVLEGIDFGVFRPKVFCIESLEFKPALQGKNGEVIIPDRTPLWPLWEDVMTDNGYEFFAETTTGLNRFYIRKK